MDLEIAGFAIAESVSIEIGTFSAVAKSPAKHKPSMPLVGSLTTRKDMLYE